jgi:hypothetical protein
MRARPKRSRTAALNEALATVQDELTKPEKDAQTSLRLPRAMYEALSKAAAEHGHGIGEELRFRLESSFVLDLGKPDTREFAEAVMQAAHQIDRAYGSWRADPFAFAVFNAAVSTLLTYYRPKGDPVPPAPEPGSIAETFFGPNALPETAGRAVAMAALAAGRKR